MPNIDFNRDGFGDILWRSNSGMTMIWQGQATGGPTHEGFTHDPLRDFDEPVDARLVGLGDFNGDGRTDLLWRGVAIYNSLAADDGTFVGNSDNLYTIVSEDWHVAGVADFNGDSRADILWRNDSGAIFDFLGTSNGGVVNNGDHSYANISTSWSLAGIGDFNGDGKADVLWRDEQGVIFNFLGASDGSFLDNRSVLFTEVERAWHVAGIGDFNGDGRDDILWQHDNGAIFTFLGTPGGGVVNNGDNSYTSLPFFSTFRVAAIGDFNGDGRDDMLRRDDVGTMSEWLGTSLGSLSNSGESVSDLPWTWLVQPNPTGAGEWF